MVAAPVGRPGGLAGTALSVPGSTLGGVTRSFPGPAVRWTVRHTPVGPLLLAASCDGLAQVVFRAAGRAVHDGVRRMSVRFGTDPIRTDAPSPGGPADAAERHLGDAVLKVDAYFRGTLRDFELPLDWSLSGGFNQRVLLELAAGVPYGSVVGYQTLADRVGEPGAARAVGVAMGCNPLPVVVACHRVVESDGGIGGFGGGLEIKRKLLALEGVLPEPMF